MKMTSGLCGGTNAIGNCSEYGYFLVHSMAVIADARFGSPADMPHGRAMSALPPHQRAALECLLRAGVLIGGTAPGLNVRFVSPERHSLDTATPQARVQNTMKRPGANARPCPNRTHQTRRVNYSMTCTMRWRCGSTSTTVRSLTTVYR